MRKQYVVRLSKLFLWPEPSRFQAYPEFLKLVDPEETYLHMADVARRAGHRMLDNRHIKHENIVRNLPGLEYNKAGEPVIRGVGIFVKEGKEYRLSEWGRRLREEYLSDPGGRKWKITLAQNLLLREPRIRSMVYILSKPGGVLRFPQSGFFTGGYLLAELEAGDKIYRPFVEGKMSAQNIQGLLNNLGAWSLGAWKKVLPGHEFVYFEGADKPQITVTWLSTATKAAFGLFFNLGLVSEFSGQIRWNIDKARQLLGPELAIDFNWGYTSQGSLLEIVVDTIKRLKADNDYLVASQLLNELRQQGIDQPEKELAGLIDRGLIRLEAWDYGQSRHGRGLFGDPGKQLVKFRIYEGGK